MKIKKGIYTKVSACVIALILFLGGCAGQKKEEKVQVSPFPVVVRGVTLEKAPAKIVSLSPVISYLIAEYGHGSRLVGRTNACTNPESLKELPTVGSGMNPDIDKIIEIEPDLVLTDRSLTKKDIDKLSGAGIKLVKTEPAASVAGIGYLYRDISLALFGKVEEQTDYTPINEVSGEYAPMFDSLINCAVDGAAMDDKEKKTFLFVSSLDGMTAGKNTIESSIFSINGKNIAEHTGYGGDLNALSKAAPDVIYAASPITLDNLKSSKVFASFEAVKNGKVVTVDSDAVNYRDASKLVDVLTKIRDRE